MPEEANSTSSPAERQPAPTPSPALNRPDQYTDADGAQQESAPCCRYSVETDDDEQFIVCAGMPNLRVYVERGLAVTKSSRKRYPKQTIFLDGAYAEAPFLDNEQRQYSLDHHVGCLRSFTLATCEQAAVILLQGLPLDEGQWRVYLNEPDLDAVLAAWLLINHADLTADENRLLHDVMPLVRVEGVIDTHGLDMGVLTALPHELYVAEKDRIDRLRATETRHRSAGQWADIDARNYTRDLLIELDGALFPQGYLDQLVQIDEVAWLPLKERKLAVLCRSDRGIYEVEAQLKQRYGRQLGVIVLDMGEGRFTLRQVETFLPRTLTEVYAQLNKQDGNAANDSGEENCWNGSAEIGGSPRQTGSALGGQAVLRIVQQCYRERRSWLRRLFSRRDVR